MTHNQTHQLRYIGIWLGLVALTILTVTTASLNVGRIGIIIVLAIAATKSTMVLLWFMHLSTEKRLLLKLLVGLLQFLLLIQ